MAAQGFVAVAGARVLPETVAPRVAARCGSPSRPGGGAGRGRAGRDHELHRFVAHGEGIRAGAGGGRPALLALSRVPERAQDGRELKVRSAGPAWYGDHTN